MNQLSGFTVSKNCLDLDYCIGLTIQSLLPICDEVVVGEMGSTDGTRQYLEAWMDVEPKLRVVPIWDWTLEKGNHQWFVNALNETRKELRFPMALQLDSDEYLSDDRKTQDIVHNAVRAGDAIALDRLNFARNAHSLIPEGECVGKYVVRVGPSHLTWCSDEPHLPGEVPLLDMAHIEPEAKIFHLGFLRKPQAFFAKSKVVLGAFFNEYDKRIADAEEKGRLPLERFPWWNRLVPYNGYYPEAVKKWMIERGHRP